MHTKENKIDRIAALCGMVWFVLIIDACFTWFLPDVTRNFIGTVFVLLGTAILSSNQGIIFSKQRRSLYLPVFALMAYMILTRFNVLSVFIYFPLICITLWRRSALSKLYFFFKRFVVFYAILSIIIEVLVISRLWLFLPRLAIFPPQDFVQESLGYVNYFYGFFCIPAENTSLTFYRACGPLREGGHWIFFLGFVYFVEKVVRGKRNIWLIICGILTLSPNIIVFLLITEGYCAIKQKMFVKPLVGVLVSVFAIFFIFYFSPQTVKDDVTRIVYERMLEKSIENSESEGVMAFLDGRAASDGLLEYVKFQKSSIKTKLLGFRAFDSYQTLSDYRYSIMLYGYLGTFFILLCTYCFSFERNRNLFGFCLLLFAFTIFLQRAWMFNQVYIWVMMLLALNKKLIASTSH